jgi:hypothetical protein
MKINHVAELTTSIGIAGSSQLQAVGGLQCIGVFIGYLL